MRRWETRSEGAHGVLLSKGEIVRTTYNCRLDRLAWTVYNQNPVIIYLSYKASGSFP